MAAHQRDAVRPEAGREIAGLLQIGNEQIGVAETVGDVPDRHLRADEAAGMDHRPQLGFPGDAERQRVLGMRVHDGHDIRPRREDRGVNKAFEIELLAVVAHRLAVEVELDDIRGRDQFRGERARDQKAMRVVGVADADMAVGVDDVLLREDAVGDHQILDQGIEAAHRR